ncbi:hypothetical protein Pan44_45840 [Caulifigura coniformis]|uniref:Carboxypeptidase regulatory-like domain-containing protein n=1 Tax=Caulifigura coniformis TaxID=2527983 RepID=A0A517SK80_9PLAN|nr:hypothetical protein [Caulifigura coniformis]QDT56528.1 hypothetical protein Pan44_45840 [Caulifigura coniformis]
MLKHILLLSVTLVPVLSGCGSDGPPLGAVTGRVTLDGKPIPGAVLTFVSQADGGSPSYGGTDDDGRYTLMFTNSKSGALVGDHIVQIETTKVSAAEAKELVAQGMSAPPSFVAIPKKYKKPGALVARVAKGGNTIDFELTSK